MFMTSKLPFLAKISLELQTCVPGCGKLIWSPTDIYNERSLPFNPALPPSTQLHRPETCSRPGSLLSFVHRVLCHKVLLTLFPKPSYLNYSISMAVSLVHTLVFIAPGFLASILFMFHPAVIVALISLSSYFTFVAKSMFLCVDIYDD